MKFNRSQIMKTAWHKHSRFGMDMSTALRLAWYEAKQAVARYTVIGERFSGKDEVIAENVPFKRAEELEWLHKCRYDRIVIKVA